ncbi:hypothetical protein LSCM1_05227 [Leishmania martiniquensis]|uniref:BRCT domain-containing protein n=1 Tax=Leishmania martiniquensis TaxID=1580590 RepID=A0A836H3G4_9TRYP|nr:hypothetical protein LSCM1_05227 [Leishmania martiniquensis]
MWGGLQFFVSIETLVSFSVPPSLSHDSAASATPESGARASAVKRAGNPAVRRLHFTQERRLTPVFTFPNATLFLQVLFSTGNKVHLMTPWDKDDTAAILRSFAWVRFLADARRVSRAPGSSQFSFSSLGVDPADYSRTVLVVDDASRWSNATALQLIEVRHTSEGQDEAASMELLYALSHCILFSEWNLRYPSSSIASCAALANTSLFAYCRFFIDSSAPQADLMRLICYHGGRIVHSAAEATHVLVLPPPPADDGASSSTSSSSTASSSTSSDDISGSERGGPSCLADSTDTDTSEEDGESVNSVSCPRSGNRSADKSRRRTSVTGAAVSLPQSRPQATIPQRPVAESIVEAPASAAQSPPVASPATNPALPPAMVTMSWVYRCVRALRLVPIDDASAPISPSPGEEKEEGERNRAEGTSNAETARATGVLLCVLLPPADARPLLWTTLDSIASQHGYDMAALVQDAVKASSSKTVTAASVLAALTSPAYSDVVEVRLQTPPAPGKSMDASTTSSRSRGAPVTRRTLDSLKLSSASSELNRIALHRCERRRDKEAVFSHLQLIASQFLYSFQYLLRQQSQALHCDAGTQTSGVRRAFMGTMTEEEQQQQQQQASWVPPADEEEPAGAKETAAALLNDAQRHRRKQAFSSEMATAAHAAEMIVSDVVGSVDEEEWRHHLRNVEGKPLMSHVGANQVSDEKTNWRAVDGGQAGWSVGAAALSAKSAWAPNAHVMDSAENMMLKSTFMGEDLTPAPPRSPTAVEGISGEPPPFRPPVAPSLLQPPTSLMPPPPPMGKLTKEARGKVDASLTEFTACFIPTAVLTADQQYDFYAFLCSLPLFDSAELGNSVVRVADGVRCQFANHKGAADFLRIEFIEFLSLHLPIVPVVSDPPDVADLHRTIMDFPFLPPPTAPEVTQEEARSLWTAPALPEATAFASQASERARTTHPSESSSRPCRSEPRLSPAHLRSPGNRKSDTDYASHAEVYDPRREDRTGSRRKRDRDGDNAEESPLAGDHYRHRDRYRSDRRRDASSRRTESSSSSQRRHHGKDRSGHHGHVRGDLDRSSRDNDHHRSHSRRGRR